jgi:hypothetical protein
VEFRRGQRARRECDERDGSSGHDQLSGHGTIPLLRLLAPHLGRI